jgi:hypothetical protein
MESKIMRRCTTTGLLLGVVTLIWLQVAHAESMIPPYCKCNDDCTYKWPYSGICQPGYGSAYCGWSGPGIPCDAGAPYPDVATKCTCDKDCYGGMVCQQASSGLRFCSVYGPGTPCDGGGIKKDMLDAGPPMHPCTCNKDCSYYGLLCNKTPYGLRCASGGPGIPCVPRDIGLPEGDPWYDDMWWPHDTGVHRESDPVWRDGDPNAALPPRTGCSLGAGALTGSRAIPGLVVLLAAGALLLIGRRRSR